MTLMPRLSVDLSRLFLLGNDKQKTLWQMISSRFPGPVGHFLSSVLYTGASKWTPGRSYRSLFFLVTHPVPFFFSMTDALVGHGSMWTPRALHVVTLDCREGYPEDFTGKVLRIVLVLLVHFREVLYLVGAIVWAG